jgi:RNA polymerase sigma factor (TIGR02999 family)
MTSDADSAVPATDALFVSLYDELKRLAHRQLHAVGVPATLRTTELVHEAWLKLGRVGDAAWDGRGHFFAAAARAMRQVLVDFARRRYAAKRGGVHVPVSLRQADLLASHSLDVELDGLLDLDAALDLLDAASPRLRQVVELRFFGGLSEDEIAQLLGLSVRTVERDWLKARLFLLRELERAGGELPNV